jgi:phosphatidylethanolamine N-methyltransferase
MMAFNVNWTEYHFLLSVASICFNPIFWNVMARLEYKTHFLTKMWGSPYRGCYFLAVVIFSLGLLRDQLYHLALRYQPHFPWDDNVARIAAAPLFVVGLVLVLSSFFRLGITGTFLGDYFGILMKEKVTGFPFNITNDPMYNGSSLLFLADAIANKSPAGVILSFVAFVAYQIAAKFFEGPFTAYIYSQKTAVKTPAHRNSLNENTNEKRSQAKTNESSPASNRRHKRHKDD